MVNGALVLDYKSAKSAKSGSLVNPYQARYNLPGFLGVNNCYANLYISV